MLKIGISQTNSIIGDFKGNTLMIIDGMKKASDNKTELLVFPELVVCGYYPCDLLNEPDFIDKSDAALQDILAVSKEVPELTTIIGTVRHNSGLGKSLYNALVVIKNGKITTEYYKQLLPTYNVFDEKRHFEPGPALPCVIDINGTKVGLLICEDGWNDSGMDYKENPFAQIAQKSPDVVVSINASPSNFGKLEQRQQIMSSAAIRNQLPILYVNSVGGQDSLVFDGGTFAMSVSGDVVFQSAQFESTQDYLFFDKLTGFIGETENRQQLERDELSFQQIVLGLKDYTRKCGFNKVVVGCSGGIDSALTLALAVEAFGADAVKAITMPSSFSSDGSVTDSEILCRNLGVELVNHPIKDLVAQYKKDFEAAFNKPLKGLPLENLQARTRGTILMEYSNEFGALLLSTGNKSEISIGYCTLYGDTNGGLNLIGDLYKTEVYRLSNYINERAGREIIPYDVITKPPSAELAPDQKDTDSLPEYEVLDPILKYLIEGKQLSEKEYRESKEFSVERPELVEKIKKMISRNEYKRFQAAPIIRIRSRAFGNGRQMPIAAKY